MRFIYSFIKRRRVERSTRDDNNDAAPCHPQVQPHPRRVHLSIALSLIDQPRHDPMYFVFSTSESFAHWASSSLQTSPKVNSGFSAMILGCTSPTKLLKGYSKGNSSSQVVLVLYRALSLCFASLHVRLTHESAARVLVSLRCSKIRAATSTPGSKENLASSWWVCDMRVLVRGEVLSRGLFRGAILFTLDPRKTGTGE